jgi:hypothetical protein
VLAAYKSERRWLDSIRSALAALLVFFEEEPATGRLLVVESLASGPRTLRRRAEILRELGAIFELGRREAKAGQDVFPVASEWTVGAVLSVIYARLIDGGERTLAELAGPLMSMIVLPYLGPAAAKRELERAPIKHASAPRAERGDPLLGLEMRVTYRTVRVLGAVAAQPGASNRDIGRAAGVEDAGQISKLLARMARLELIENCGSRIKGSPNAWTLTRKGFRFHGVVSTQAGLSSDT